MESYCDFFYYHFSFISFILISLCNSSAYQSDLRQMFIWNNIKHSLRNLIEQILKDLVNVKTYMIHSKFGL